MGTRGSPSSTASTGGSSTAVGSAAGSASTSLFDLAELGWDWLSVICSEFEKNSASSCCSECCSISTAAMRSSLEVARDRRPPAFFLPFAASRMKLMDGSSKVEAMEGTRPGPDGRSCLIRVDEEDEDGAEGAEGAGRRRPVWDRAIAAAAALAAEATDSKLWRRNWSMLMPAHCEIDCIIAVASWWPNGTGWGRGSSPFPLPVFGTEWWLVSWSGVG